MLHWLSTRAEAPRGRLITRWVRSENAPLFFLQFAVILGSECPPGFTAVLFGNQEEKGKRKLMAIQEYEQRYPLRTETETVTRVQEKATDGGRRLIEGRTATTEPAKRNWVPFRKTAQTNRQ